MIFPVSQSVATGPFHHRTSYYGIGASKAEQRAAMVRAWWWKKNWGYVAGAGVGAVGVAGLATWLLKRKRR